MSERLQVLRHVSAIDVIDVAIVALFLFILLDWVRHHISVRGLAILALLIAIELFAYRYNLYLTKIIVQAALVLLVIIWLVVFQSDIRRTIDRIAIWGATRQRFDEGSPLVDTLTQTAAWMAERRMGALICLRGTDPWERHVEGGIELHGEVSQPLLVSIFSTASPGHDGAMMIDGDKVVRFAAHLPLSSNLAEIGDHGTRHAAGLGLSELCDAFVIMVSEEHGTISIARQGRLTHVSPGQLKSNLSSFTIQDSARDRIKTAWWKRPAIPIAIIALLLATFGRLSLFYSEPVYRTFSVPVELRRVPANVRVIEPPMNIAITLSGSANAFRVMNASQLVVRLNLSRLEQGVHDYRIVERNINLPVSVELVEADPPLLRIRAERK